jgi:translocation and assembly module TamB
MPRAWRIGAWTLGSLLTVVVVLVAAVWIAGNTASGRHLIERSVGRYSAGHMRIAGLAGSFPAAIDLQQLQLSDERGVWLSADSISLRWSPLALLARHLKVESLHIARVAIERRPVSQPSADNGSGRLPHIDLTRLTLDVLELGPQLAGVSATLSIEGTAHIVSLADATATLTAHRSNGAGDYRIGLRSDPSRMDAQLSLREPAGGALANLLQLPGLGALSVEASLKGPRNAERLGVTASAGELRARAQGTLDLTRAEADLSYRLDAPAMSATAGLSWQRIALQGQWQGAVDAPRAVGSMQIDRLRIPGGGELAALSANLRANGGELTVSALADGVVLPGPQPRLLAASPLRMKARIGLRDAARPLELTAEHRLFTLQAQAVTATAKRATFTVRLPDLTPLAAAAGQKAHGKAELQGTVESNPTTTLLNLNINSELANDATLLTSMLAGSSRMQLAVALSEQALEVQRLTLNGRALTASLSGSARRAAAGGAQFLQSVRARFEASVANLAVLSPTLAGPLHVAGRFDGPIASFASSMQLTASPSIRGAPPGQIDATLNARGLPALTNATMRAEGHLAGAPLRVDASLDHAQEAFHLLVRRAEWKSAHMEGDLTAGASKTSARGDLRMSVEHLEDLQPLVGTSLAGSIAAQLALKPVAGRTYTQLQLAAKNVVVADLRADAQLSAAGPTDALALRLTVQSPDLQGAPGSLAAAGRFNLTRRELRLQQAEARYRAQSVRLLTPATVALSEGVKIDSLRLGLQDAVIELAGQVSPLNVHAAVHRVDASLINAFMPQLLSQGTVDADARLAGTPSAPTGMVTINATQLRLSAARDLQALDIHASARLAGNSAQLEARLNASRDSHLTLTGTAPLSAQGNLDLKLNGKLDAGFANALLEARGERMAGILTVSAAATGTIQSPELAGTVDLANGDLRDYFQGAHLSKITAHLTGSHGSLKIESLTARAGPGEFSATGELGLMQPKLPVTLRLTAKNAQPVTSDVLTANLDADITAEGNLRERIGVAGTISVSRAVITIPNALPPQVAVLDVRRPGQVPPPPTQHKLVVGLDLKLHAPREILVQGRGLNAELGGDLRILGTTAAPEIGGGLNMIRGTFALASSRLNFTSGRVSFSGTGPNGKIDPALDFTAQTTVSDATATLHVTGLADAPRFDLSSTPPLPQDEILARLLFGQSASQLTALQVAQIGAALASLSGVGGSGPNPLAKVQKALGLDVLSVGSSNTAPQAGQSSGTTVEAGRYVSNRVFVAGKQSSTGFSQVEVDVDLSKHLKLQTRLGNGTATTQGITPENDPGSSIGMLYQFQY